VRLDSSFSYASNTELVNAVKKIVRSGGRMILDSSKPYGDSYITEGVRVSAVIEPCVDSNIGAVASIRRQKPAEINYKMLVEGGTVIPDELEMLELFAANGISMAFAGSTGAGKTANMGYVLSKMPFDRRIVTIEESRELNLQVYDNSGSPMRDLVQWKTRDGKNAVTIDQHLRNALRFHPGILIPAEMRGREAVTCIEAGRTGHTIITTVHANGAIDAYNRILTMYLMGETTLSEERILKIIVEAIPIIVFSRQLKDNSRKILEVFEAEKVQGGEVIGRSLFKFHPEGTDANGKIMGVHKKVSGISEKLQDRLLLDGVSPEIVEKFS
jgi:pilus assembly protein CpaF